MQARKRFGQNFLTDHGTIDRIIGAINPRAGELIVEIGPGHGALTRALSRSGCKLKVIEIDRDLAEEVRIAHPDIEVIVGDVLKLDLEAIFTADDPAKDGKQVRVVGNLPYNISTPLLFRLFKYIGHIIDMHFMLQLEVVERMVAGPSTPNYGRLSVMTQYYCEPEKLFAVPASAFTPKPKVMSAIVRLSQRTRGPGTDDFSILESLVNQAFSQRRKTIRNGMKSYLTAEELTHLGIDPGLRPENLSLSDFVRCADYACKKRVDKGPVDEGVES
jgi:16S rRNA (adenine1518-N6/adenine1519-N6)-dimethyltransferase